MDQAFKAALCAQVNQPFHISDWIKKTLSSRTVRDGGSATFIPAGPVQLELTAGGRTADRRIQDRSEKT
jgi:hypothetical protein